MIISKAKFLCFSILFLVGSAAIADPTSLPTVEQIIKKLDLKPYPMKNSGFYAESYKSSEKIKKENLPSHYNAKEYNLSSSVYYLLPKGDKLKFHSTKASKQYHHYLGAPMKVIIINKKGILKEVMLGKDLLKNQQLHLTLPANSYVAAILDPSTDQNQYALIGCTTTPGWEKEDCDRITTEKLINKFPQHKEKIQQFM